MSTESQLDRVRRLFDDWAIRGRAEGMELGHTPTARPAFESLELSAGQRYLDIGCGNGYTVRWAAAVDPTVQAYGLDASEQMVARARHLSEGVENARFIHAPFPLPALKARSFDAIFSMEVFYYLPDVVWGLLSVFRLLKPGGHFACIVDYYAENEASHSWPTDVNVPMTLWSAAEWREKLETVGLEVLDQRRLCPPLAPGEEPTWKHTEGSLYTLARRSIDAV